MHALRYDRDPMISAHRRSELRDRRAWFGVSWCCFQL